MTVPIDCVEFAYELANYHRNAAISETYNRIIDANRDLNINQNFGGLHVMLQLCLTNPSIDKYVDNEQLIQLQNLFSDIKQYHNGNNPNIEIVDSDHNHNKNAAKSKYS